MTVWLALILGAVGFAVLCMYRMRQVRKPSTQTVASEPTNDEGDAPLASPGDASVPFHTENTLDAQAATYQLAFGVRRFDYRIFSDHDGVLQKVVKSLDSAIHEQRHFPRRPALLPKLLHAINDGDSTRESVARLILQDPVLAGNVLKRANSVYYLQKNAPVESVERAIVVLGTEGLRAPVAAAVMQPVFQLPRGFFDQFAPMTWEQARRSAQAAEAYARLHQAGDPFIANLIGLLGGLGRIVLFRITLDQYRERGNLMPRAEVFIRLMMDHGRMLTRQIAASWQLSDNFLAALDVQIAQQSPIQMSPLARALYYGELSGSLALLENHQQRTRDESCAILEHQGLNRTISADLLNAANTVD
ncbi:MAG: HDOD domain-containing protein [Candidatus Obscuribacterales bacterium]|nr:HDOD domain-containing protein [Steroidobacteraceae bacterium]